MIGTEISVTTCFEMDYNFILKKKIVSFMEDLYEYLLPQIHNCRKLYGGLITKDHIIVGACSHFSIRYVLCATCRC